MPTYAFTRTREQMRDLVMRTLGKLATGQTVAAEDAVIVYEAMDLRLKELHARNILWFNVAGATTDVALTAGTATASAASDVLFPVSLMLQVGTEGKDVRIVGHTEYQAITTKTEQGEPELAFFSGGVFRFWPVPNQNYTAKLTYEQVAADTAPATAPDVEVSMMRSFAAIVAYDLVDQFQLKNEARIARLKYNADEGMKTIRALNAERVGNQPVTPEYF